MTDKIEPARAVKLYIQEKQPELSDATIYSHRSRLSHFTRWCESEGIEDMQSLTQMSMHEYRLWRREDGDINTVTEKTQMDTLRVFIRWCESLGAVERNLSESVLSPSLDKHENERDVKLDSSAAELIREHLEKYAYATFDHVCFLLMWHGLLRRGGIRAIDLPGDEINGDEPFLTVEHQPETGTPLKNKHDGDRLIGISPTVRDVIKDYIRKNRHPVIDEHGREPLLSTRQGRPHAQTIQAASYAVTRPCVASSECPHGKDPSECDAARDRQKAYECPSSLSPHAVRRGAITHWLAADVPAHHVGERCNTDPDVISKHYDRRDPIDRMRQRRRYLDRFDE